MSRIGNTWRRISLVAVAVAALATSRADAGDKIEFNRDVRPILSENCFRCHGPDSASRKAGLRLDKREVAIETGAIVPNDPDASDLIDRLHSTEADKVMPPPATKKTLSAEQKDTLKRWIASGAEYQPHWSFIAPQKPEPPTVKHQEWVRNPIDRFILAGLEEKGLAPAPEADRRTLARRLSLDLTGLPPAPADVDAFVNDTSPDYYEKYVDKMLASPAWGEHRGRYWLDAARYADTHGIHFDNYREMWIYRDWVIKALNKNMPFDQFGIEQIAGDILPNRTMEQQIASGFNRCNITTNEGGAIDEEYKVLYTRDRTETVSQVFMGLTTGCAVCHDHKFDPISQKEFYSLAAFFNNTTQAAMDGNIPNTPPALFVPTEEDRQRWESAQREQGSLKAGLDARRTAARAGFDAFVDSASADNLAANAANQGLKFSAALDDRNGTTVPNRLQGPLFESSDLGDFEKEQAFSYGAWIRLSRPGIGGSILARMDDGKDFRGWDLWLDGNKIAAHVVSTWPADAIKVTGDSEIKPGEWTHVFASYDGSGKAAGLRLFVNGRLQTNRIDSDVLKSSIRTTVPLKVGQRHKSASTMKDVQIHDVRLYGRALTGEDVAALAGLGRAGYLASIAKDKRPAAEVEELFTWWLGTYDAPTKELKQKLAANEAEQAAIKARGTVAHVMQERPEPPSAFLLMRGDYDKRKDPVSAATPAVLPPMPADQPKNRLGLARWLFRPEHPLTARVTVNRFWQEVFGTGLVRTAGDFGISGELPSHPELLDWLAVDFREGGWDMKRFFKQIVTSAAYRQSAQTTAEKLEKDPSNRLISRGPRFRMDAEMVRDEALAVSGLLSPKIGGPSVRPYQPEGVWEAVAIIGSNTRDYKADSGESLYRRSIYTFWKRSAPPASMDIFNAPSREVCAVRRERTNTPLQALVTLNDIQFVEAARRLAETTLKTGGDTTEAKLDSIARKLIARPLRAEEMKVVKGSLDALIGHYKAHAEDAKQLVTVGDSKPDATLDVPTLAAWTMISNELMNLDEVLNK